ncbi:hypothetical protein QFZ28_005873 [Neobacillus niacini]|uniref:hypothetical protein n=1 Tax=Neobacillus niacini TaxID=86668 RepID=UPI0027852512|nr:hypothetical protein [Neobacillus niacini]MDQ1005295.1 hypothetical protein [Neobacillus niacini]
MRIRGKIYNKRSYIDDYKQNKTSILFVELEEKLKVNGEMIKFIPMICAGLSDFSIGEKVEVDGIVRFESIKTLKGNLSFSPIPVIRPLSGKIG